MSSIPADLCGDLPNANLETLLGPGLHEAGLRDPCFPIPRTTWPLFSSRRTEFRVGGRFAKPLPESINLVNRCMNDLTFVTAVGEAPMTKETQATPANGIWRKQTVSGAT